MKLLIVEDEKKTGEYLTKGLTEAGFVVDLADNGLNGYHLAMTGAKQAVNMQKRRKQSCLPCWRRRRK